jgi:hypothetical protein
LAWFRAWPPLNHRAHECVLKERAEAKPTVCAATVASRGCQPSESFNPLGGSSLRAVNNGSGLQSPGKTLVMVGRLFAAFAVDGGCAREFLEKPTPLDRSLRQEAIIARRQSLSESAATRRAVHVCVVLAIVHERIGREMRSAERSCDEVRPLVMRHRAGLTTPASRSSRKIDAEYLSGENHCVSRRNEPRVDV